MSDLLPCSSVPVFLEKAVVRHSYDADNEDELTLKVGDIVNIISKDAEDPGWWKGELNGKIGMFPDNFVEIVQADEFGTDQVLRPSLKLLQKTEPQPRPKKPPPPSIAAAPQATVKLPDKVATVEPALTEKHVKKKEDLPSVEKTAPPALPSKKPSVPPPLLRKPAKPEPPQPTSQAEHKRPPPTTKEEPPMEMSQSVTEEKKPSAAHFDDIQSSSDKLTHLTASRPKGPSKRPPSQVFNHTPQGNPKLIQEEERNGDVKDTHWAKEDKTVHSKHVSPPPIKEEVPLPQKATPPARPPEPTATVPTAAIASLQTALEELKKEMQHLKSATVSKTAFDELKQENEKLRHELDSLKASSNRKFRDIINEVDEEKKIRLSTQVEIERIKKLVNESHV